MKRVQLDPNLARPLDKAFPQRSLTFQVARCVSAYVYIRQEALQTLQGRFSEGELISLLDAYNGYLFTTDLMIWPSQKGHLVDAMRLAIEENKYVQKFGINADEMLEKLELLREGEAITLVNEIDSYWFQKQEIHQFIDLFFNRESE